MFHLFIYSMYQQISNKTGRFVYETEILACTHHRDSTLIGILNYVTHWNKNHNVEDVIVPYTYYYNTRADTDIIIEMEGINYWCSKNLDYLNSYMLPIKYIFAQCVED